jgi:ribosomal protein L9
MGEFPKPPKVFKAPTSEERQAMLERLANGTARVEYSQSGENEGEENMQPGPQNVGAGGAEVNPSLSAQSSLTEVNYQIRRDRLNEQLRIEVKDENTGETIRMSEEELRDKLFEIIGKRVNVNKLSELTEEDIDKIVSDEKAGAYFRALATMGWTHTSGDGSSFDQVVFNALTKVDKTLAASCRKGGKGRDLLAFSDNAAFVRMGMGDALKDDIKAYGNDETQGLIQFARKAVDSGMNILHAKLVWDEIASKIDHNEPISEVELIEFKMAGAIKVTKEITTEEVKRLSSQGGIKYGHLVRASELAPGQKTIFSQETQKELNKFRLAGDKTAADIIGQDDLEELHSKEMELKEQREASAKQFQNKKFEIAIESDEEGSPKEFTREDVVAAMAKAGFDADDYEIELPEIDKYGKFKITINLGSGVTAEMTMTVKKRGQ